MLSNTHDAVKDPPPTTSFSKRVLRIDWLGQTAASVCWIISVFAYGPTSAGDYLQLSAASAWLIANIAAITLYKSD